MNGVITKISNSSDICDEPPFAEYLVGLLTFGAWVTRVTRVFLF